MTPSRIFLIFTIIFSLGMSAVSAETIREKELKRIELNKKYDKLKLRERDDFVTDCSKDFLVEPEEKAAAGKFSVAKVPPIVKMRIIPGMEPEYFTDMDEDGEAYMVAWANWARVTRSEDNRFYFAVSDHRGTGCHLNIYEYSPARNTVDRVVDFGKVAGWTDKTLTDGNDEKHRLLSFDPEYNKFERYEVTMPENPFTKETRQFRGYTDYPAMDGYFYCVTYNGAMFKFLPGGPDGPVVEPMGVSWNEGMDVLQMMVSPKGRYVYYYPRDYPAPLVQYDVKTGRKKALCWLHDYYFEKYGYWIGSSYGMEISKDGKFIVICMNGAFQGRNESYGHPSLFVIEIPEEEREE